MKLTDFIMDVNNLGAEGYDEFLDYLNQLQQENDNMALTGMELRDQAAALNSFKQLSVYGPNEARQYAEELAMLEENAIIGDRLYRQDIITLSELVISHRLDQYGRRYIEVVNEHGRSEIVTDFNWQFQRRSNLG